MTTDRPKLILLPNDRAVIQLGDWARPDEVEHVKQKCQEVWDKHDPIILNSVFEVIDQSQPDIESRLAAVEQTVDALKLVSRCRICGHVPVDHRVLGERGHCWGECPCILTRGEAARQSTEERLSGD